MTRVLLIGGYGGFGARIARRLADAGHEVLVAGRSLGRAQAFCAGDPRLTPMAIDRDGDIAAAIAGSGVDMVVDAAGPFQGSSYAMPRACIAAGVHYCDIADARGFVTGIGVLDADARAAGVAVIAGASSVSALSGAAVHALAEGVEDVRAVEMAISASAGATAGTSVAAAILGQVGRPLRLWRHGRWTLAHGWQEPRRETFALPGEAAMRRIVALADVPDLDLLPERLPGRPAVTFRAGTGVTVQTLALVAGGWAVRLGVLRSLAPLARWAAPLQRITARAGGGRSAMVVRLFGIAGGRRVERRWTLVAEKNDGPEIPTLAVPLLVERLHCLAPGARDAGELLTLPEFDAAFADLHIRHASEERPLPPPLYARIMGTAFDSLPAPVRAIHDVLRDGGASGQATVRRGRNPLARMIAALVGFPAAGEHDVQVDFTEQDGRETWTRRFSDRPFRSTLSKRNGRLVEQFGPLAFAFDLPADADGLRMVMRGWRLGPLPLPLALRSEAREWAEGERFHFDVPIVLPLIGLLVHYTGWLLPRHLSFQPAADLRRARGIRRYGSSLWRLGFGRGPRPATVISPELHHL